MTITLASKRYTLLAYGTTLDSRYPEGGAAEAWQLAVDHYVQAKMSPVIVHPRPDSETSSWERHRMAPDGIAWSIPIVVQGGSWPFQYAVTDGPVGMTIGAEYGDAGYGVLSWASPSIGTHSVVVRVRTQDYMRVAGSADSTGESTVEFTLIVADKTDTTKFVFLDATGGDNANSGAYASPKQTLAGVYDVTTFGGCQLFLRTGTYNTTAAANLTANTTHPAVIVSYPGEVVTVDYTQRRWLIARDGFYASGLTGTEGGYGAVEDNARYFACASARQRVTLNSCSIDAASGGVADDSNATLLFMIGGLTPPEAHKYVSMIGCSDTNRASTGNGASLCIAFQCSYIVLEGCTIANATAGPTALFKDRIYYGTVRNCDFEAASSTNVLGLLCQNGSSDMEVSWTRVRGTGTQNRLVRINGQDSADAGTVWMYRCNFEKTVQTDPGYYVIEALQINTEGVGPFAIERCVIEHGNTRYIEPGVNLTSDAVTDACSGSAVVDASGDLEAAYSDYLGLAGWRVS